MDSKRQRRKASLKKYNAKRNLSPERKLLNYKSHLKTTYGMTVKQYEDMYKVQNGLCAICARINTSGKRMYIDHNHVTGKIRGLLCRKCNLLLGNAEDNIFTLIAAQDYLEGVIHVH